MGGYGSCGERGLASRAGTNPSAAVAPAPGRHCYVDGEPSLLVEWRRVVRGWEGRVISVAWLDAWAG